MDRWTDPDTLRHIPEGQRGEVRNAVREALRNGPEEGLTTPQIAYAASRDYTLVGYALLDLQELEEVGLAYSRYDDENYGAYKLKERS